MQNILPNPHMDGDRNLATVSLGQKGNILIGKIPLPNGMAQSLANTQPVAGCLFDHLVDAAGFRPQAELTGANIAGHTLGRGTNQGKFPVVDWTGAIEGNAGDMT